MSKDTLLHEIKNQGSVRLGDYILWYEHGKVTLDYNFGEKITEFKTLEDAYENGMIDGVSIKDFTADKTLDDLFSMTFTEKSMI